MNYTKQIAKDLRGIYFGGNWTDSNLKDQLADVTWQQATTQIYSLNTIATLVFHINYFILVATKMLEEGVVEGNDKLSFDHPPIQSQEDWDHFLNQVWKDGEHFADLIEQLPSEKLGEIFGAEKYGTYYRNLQGIIEHSHYHLGQIAVIKKIYVQDKTDI